MLLAGKSQVEIFGVSQQRFQHAKVVLRRDIVWLRFGSLSGEQRELLGVEIEQAIKVACL